MVSWGWFWMDVQGYINVCGYITLPVRVLPHCLPCTQTPPQHRERKTARTLQMSRLKLSAKKAWKMWKWLQQVMWLSIKYTTVYRYWQGKALIRNDHSIPYLLTRSNPPIKTHAVQCSRSRISDVQSGPVCHSLTQCIGAAESQARGLHYSSLVHIGGVEFSSRRSHWSIFWQKRLSFLWLLGNVLDFSCILSFRCHLQNLATLQQWPSCIQPFDSKITMAWIVGLACLLRPQHMPKATMTCQTAICLDRFGRWWCNSTLVYINLH